jgi:hypothetical protein
VFLGHFAVAFAAKKVAPDVSLGTLFIATQLADLLWPVFFLLGLEAFEIRPGITAATPLEFIHYPYSHSLVALLGWAAVFGAIYVLLGRGHIKAALVIASVVVSHWVLDVVAHRPDMPITIHGDLKLGFGLWNSIAATVFAESALFASGVFLYTKMTRAVDRVGRIGLCALVALLIAIFAAATFGSPPPSKMAVPAAGFAMWLLVAFAYWIDRHRNPVGLVSA